MSGLPPDAKLLLPVVAAVACLVGGVVLLGDAAVSALRGPDAPAAAPDRPDAPTPPPATTTTAPAATPTATVGADPLAGRVVVVDPGHNRDGLRSPVPLRSPVDVGGGTAACDTPGSRSDDGYAESTFTWRTGLAVRRRLEALGAEVVLTRPADAGVGPCVDARGLTAGRVGADLLVSLHADDGPADGAGFHVTSPADGPTAATSGRVATAVRDAVRATGLRTATYAGTDGLEVRDGLGALDRSTAPAVEVDCGTLRNPAEARRLASGGGQEQCAAGVVAGVLAHLSAPAPSGTPSATP